MARRSITVLVDNCIGEGVAVDVALARVTLEKLDVGDLYAMPVSAGKETVAVGHVYQ